MLDLPMKQSIQGAPPQSRRADALRRCRQDVLLDEALRETFPASDPISAMQFT